jgi:amidase
VNPEIAAGVEDIARMCETMGHDVEAAKPQIDLEPYFSALRVFWGASMRFSCDYLAQKMKRPLNREHLEPVTLKVYEDAGQFTAADVIRARSALNLACRRVGAFFERYDLLLTPTIAELPVPIGTIDQNQDVPLEKWFQGTSQFNAFTNLFNATGLPAISLPLGQSKTGLPIGFQFAADFGKEDLLIRVAGAFEKAMPWVDRKPPVHVDSLI